MKCDGAMVNGCDNAGAVVALNAGRAKADAEANAQIRDIFEIDWKNPFDVVAVWVPTRQHSCC